MRPEQLLRTLQAAFVPGLMAPVHVGCIKILPRAQLRPTYPAELPGDARESDGDREEQRHSQAGHEWIAPTPTPGAFNPRNGPCMDRFVAEKTAEFVGQLLSALIAARRLLLQALDANRFEIVRD